MKRHHDSGVVDPISLALVIAVIGGAALLAGWKPLEFLKPKPPTEQLAKLQAQLDNANLAAEQARQAQEKAMAAERAKFNAQVQAVQQDNLGTTEALSRVPPEHLVAEVKLGKTMAFRESVKLVAMIGKLPDAQRDEMVQIIDEALSGKQAEIDAANAKLAQKDAEFTALTKERDAIKAQIPVLEQKASNAAEIAKAKAAEVASVTEKLKEWAAKADAKARENGSLSATVDRFFYGLLVLGALYLLLAIVIPGIIKHMQSGGTKNFLRDVSGYLTSPLLYLDAKTKIPPAPPTS